MSRRTTSELIKDANAKHRKLLAGEEFYKTRKTMDLPRNHLMQPLIKQQKILIGLADRIAARVFSEADGFHKDLGKLKDAVRCRYSGKLKFE
jgi:hypothetical protein